LSFSRQPGGSYFRIVPDGIGWRSSVSRPGHGPTGTVTAVNWFAGG
jgi:hypothetical protein